MDKVLIVAPIESTNPLQSQLSEVEASISAFYRPELLLGNVTKQRLQFALTKEVAGFWYIGHAQADNGLQLSDGLLSIRLLGNYLYTANVAWSYLNTCYSEQFIVQLQAIYPHDIMANVGEIADDIAGQNGIMLAQALADTGEIRKAYRWVADTGNSVLRFFPSPVLDAMNRDDKPNFEREILRIKQVIFGDNEAGVPSFLSVLNSLKNRITRIEIILIILVTMLIIGALFVNTTRQRQDLILDYLRHSLTPTPTIYFPAYPPELQP